MKEQPKPKAPLAIHIKKEFHFDQQFLDGIEREDIRAEDDDVFIPSSQDCPCCKGYILSCSGADCETICVCSKNE